MQRDSDFLVARSITKSFGGVLALDDVSFTLSEGKIYGLIGPNGSGKSTLVNVTAGLLSPTSGSVHFRGTKLTGKKVYEITKLGVVRTFQIPRIFPHLTVEEHLQVGERDIEKDKISEILSILGLTEWKDWKPTNLGYGQRKLLELARALSLNPSLMMLDEPLAGLDSEMMEVTLNRLEYLNKSLNKTILIVEHHLEELMSIANSVLVLDHGVKIAEGEPFQIRGNPEVQEAYFGDTK